MKTQLFVSVAFENSRGESKAFLNRDLRYEHTAASLLTHLTLRSNIALYPQANLKLRYSLVLLQLRYSLHIQVEYKMLMYF